MRIYDYTCKKCGHVEKDVLIANKEEEIQTCILCNNIMDRDFPIVTIDIGLSKTPLTNYVPGKGNVNFGKL